MSEPSPLEDRNTAEYAWTRFRKLMRLMLIVTGIAIAGAMVAIYATNGLESIHMYIATALGVGFAMMLTGALMGLVFLSNGTGHDQSVSDAQSRPVSNQVDERKR